MVEGPLNAATDSQCSDRQSCIQHRCVLPHIAHYNHVSHPAHGTASTALDPQMHRPDPNTASERSIAGGSITAVMFTRTARAPVTCRSNVHLPGRILGETVEYGSRSKRVEMAI